MRRSLRILHLYPELMNLYGDRGNVLALRARCRWHGIDPRVETASLGARIDYGAYDVIVIGGGQDREQRLVSRDLAGDRGHALAAAVEDGVCLLAVCGAYQLLGKYYVTAGGETFPGVGVFDLVTEGGDGRLVGHIAVAAEGGTLAGFENHGGRTTLGPVARPLGKVLWGYGNNGRDGTEGAFYRNAFGTYLHGPLLPGNPWFADRLIALALERRYGEAELEVLDDQMDLMAHREVIRQSRLDARRGSVRQPGKETGASPR
ncbi:MAG: glutamine amidotransferase [bacterium]|nr:glutamine amidotransferase [bacterium]